MAQKPVLSLTFAVPAEGKSESKNYDILQAVTNSPDTKFPILVTAQGGLYIKKGLIDPAKIRAIRIEVTTE